jgi:hypothetical protein
VDNTPESLAPRAGKPVALRLLEPAKETFPMRTRSLSACLAATVFALGAAACADRTDDADEIAAALEQENGGLDMEDEAPLFGADDELAAAEVEGSVEYSDALAEDTEIIAMRARDGALRARIVLAWGQLPPDRDPEEYVRDWSGRLRLNRGAIVVRRTIGFEEATDRVEPRTDRLEVAFASVTRPFADGLVLDIVDDDPASAEPLTLRYERSEGGEREYRVADLLERPDRTIVDDEGNRMVAIALRHRDACDHGFARGRWRALRDQLGGMIGEVFDADGAPIGHIRGIWGVRRNGEHVFHGKYIDRDGRFRGLFGGHYRDGELVGRWLTRGGEHGRLDGRYEETVPGRRAGGHFALRWAETSCAADIRTE